jgi:hypothetical protein
MRVVHWLRFSALLAPLLLTGCVSEEQVLAAGERIEAFVVSIQPQLQVIGRILPFAVAALGILTLLFARRIFFRLHTAVIVGAISAVVLGIFGAIIGGISAYASIYAVNNYFDRLIGNQGVVLTVLGGALVGIIGLIGAMFAAVMISFLVMALVSVLTGSSVDIDIKDIWGMPVGTLSIWTPGDVGSGEGGCGCGLALVPGLLVSPIVGAVAGMRLADGNPMNLDTSWTVVAICLFISGLIGLIVGAVFGWAEGGGKGSGKLVGAVYGIIVAYTVINVLVLFRPTTFLSILTYVVCIAVFAALGSRLAPK